MALVIRLLSAALFSLVICSHSHGSPDDGKITIKDDIVVLKSNGESPREVKISLPSLSGLKDEKVHTKLMDLLSLKSLFGDSLEDIRAEVVEGDLGTQGVGFEVIYNQHNLLDINFWMETMGAYPSTINVHRAINLKTGDILTAADVFNKSKLDKLVKNVKVLKKAAEKEALKERSLEERETILDGIKEASSYNIKNLDDFSISDKGITFLYSYGFRHAVQALEPTGSYFISYKDLKPFINPHGPLGVFVK